MSAPFPPDDRASLLLEDRVKRVFRELPGAVAGQEEPVHQVRVAGRRLRVSLPLLARKGQGRRVRRALKVLRQLTRTLGEGRDVDVILGLFEDRLATRTSPSPSFARGGSAAGARGAPRRLDAPRSSDASLRSGGSA